jgi:hypothetical protein
VQALQCPQLQDAASVGTQDRSVERQELAGHFKAVLQGCYKHNVSLTYFT